MNRIAMVVLACVVGCVTWVQSRELSEPWRCGVVLTQQQPENNDYWHELAPLPLGGVDRVIWDGSFQEATSDRMGPGGRWFGLHAANTDVPASDYRRVISGIEGSSLELLQPDVTPGEAWVHGFQFGEALGGVEEIPLSPSHAITVRFRARTLSYHPLCDPFSVTLFVHDRSDPGHAKQLLSSEQMFIPDTGGLWIDCELSVRLDSGSLIDVFDAAQWAPRVAFGLFAHGDEEGVLRIDDIEVVISNCMREPVGLLSEYEACGILQHAFNHWSFMCEGEYAGGGQDGTSPLELPESCPVDIDGDCEVAVGDLLAVISGWGVCPEDEYCLADINGDGWVDVSDLLTVIATWGEQCE